MNRPSLIDRTLLELERAAQRVENIEHRLKQLFWECTLRCNSSCRHCGSDCRTISTAEDMPLEHLLSLLDSRPSNIDPSLIMVVTTGGEPLLRGDILQCGKEITRRGFRWGMVTNGLLLTEQMLAGLLCSGLDSIAISLDGFEQQHNWMRGNSRGFALAEQAIKSLVRVGDRVSWDVITCVNSKNIETIEEFKCYLLELGVRRWRIFTIAPMGRALQNPELFLNSTSYRSLMEFISRQRKVGDMRVEYSCEGFLGEYEGRVRDHLFNCVAGVNVASILNDGSISGCLSIRSSYHQGNIYRDNFWKVWEERFQEYRNRQWMRQNECAECKVWRYCRGGAMHLRSDNGEMIQCNYRRIIGEH